MPTPNIYREQQAIKAWKKADAGVTESPLQIPNEGLFIVSSRATDLGGGTWHYEYAVYNMNSDLSCGTFSVPVPDSATVSNIEFHDVDYTDGDGFGNVNISGTDWVKTRANNTLSWSTQTFAANANGNALRWASLYNFRFDANVAPMSGQATVTTWKAVADYPVAAQVPTIVTAPCYANCDGSSGVPILNVNDFLCFQNLYAQGSSLANCDNSTTEPTLNVLDFICFQSAFATGCP
jgi:hypothetical protein